jgi:hypothetical protein
MGVAVIWLVGMGTTSGRAVELIPQWATTQSMRVFDFNHTKIVVAASGREASKMVEWKRNPLTSY